MSIYEPLFQYKNVCSKITEKGRISKLYKSLYIMEAHSI